MKQFLGSEAITSYDDAQVVILPIPYEKTTTYRKGCKHGAMSIIDASDQLEAYDEELQQETCFQTGIYTAAPIVDTRINPTIIPEEMLLHTTQAVKHIIQDDKFAIALGGEHAITQGVVQAYQQVIDEPFTVIQIDAHGDLRYSYQGSIYNHACVMRRILELDLPILPVGIRSICQEEAELIAQKKIPVVYARDIYYSRRWRFKAIANIPTEKVFITIDLDGLDPSLIPGVGTPQPGGLNWYELTRFLKQIFLQKEVIGCDVMELAPLNDSVVSQFTAAKLVYKLIGYHNLSKTKS